MSLLRLYSKAIRQRADKVALSQFKPPELPTCEYERYTLIDAKHYQRYCELTGWRDKNIVHPCYLQMLSLPLQLQCLTTPKSPFPVMGLVHKENQVWVSGDYQRQVPLHLFASYRNVRQHRRGWEVDIEVKGRQDKQWVFHSIASYLVNVKAAHVAPVKKGDNTTQRYHVPQQWLDCGALQVKRGIGRRYAWHSGDFNPIHLSRVSASMFGFRRALAHGMWSLAATCGQLIDSPLECTSLAIDARFNKPLFIPAQGRIFTSAPGQKQAFVLTNEKADAPHIQGSIVKDRPLAT